MKALAFFLLVVFYKFFSNFMCYRRIKILHKYFSEFIDHKRTDMNQYKQEVISLFKKANVKDIKLLTSESIGYGHIASATISVFSMFPSLRPNFAGESLNMFENAEGSFKKNMRDSFNPFYWIDLIIFLPKNLLSYLDFSPDAFTYKLCNLLLTFMWWLLGILFLFFKPQIQQFIIEFVRNF